MRETLDSNAAAQMGARHWTINNWSEKPHETHTRTRRAAEGQLYPIRTARDGGAAGPCVLAGPTCDSMDVLYEKTPYELPISLEIGDKVLIEGTGAYTATYASVGFNGFAPLKAFHI